ncbi:hypothetical protein J7443_09320 [Tropicibacter sp. R15_0]|uniref:hypothetical protein n=1 Tax=Tropicibacter sp. R15_0 TaxID=2821101 RepID=UPI001AD9C1CA|nr:hypothetical protein [Tropicibacter sp. R15_0]MBO9465427.1 hypothetical protein [Tropicibacter sp. R15_0]
MLTSVRPHPPRDFCRALAYAKGKAAVQDYLMYKFLAGMIFMAALAAFFTKPGPDAAEAELKSQLMTAISTQKLGEQDGLNAAALLACRLDPNSCYDLLRSGIDLTYEDRYLYAKLDLDGFERQASCYGLYTKFYCPGGLQKQ